MADYTKYTKQEMQAYAIAKNIKENQIVIVGTGLPHTSEWQPSKQKVPYAYQHGSGASRACRFQW